MDKRLYGLVFSQFRAVSKAGLPADVDRPPHLFSVYTSVPKNTTPFASPQAKLSGTSDSDF